MEQEDGFEKVVDRYADMIYRIAFSRVKNQSDADDIFQEVFIRYLKKRPRFEREEHRKAWLIRVTVNCTKKFWIAAARKRATPLYERTVFMTEEDIWLREALQELPPNDRVIIHLFYYEDLSVRDISRILKQKDSTVRTQLTRARRRLKEILKEDDDV